jgi:hypothetical protein
MDTYNDVLLVKGSEDSCPVLSVGNEIAILARVAQYGHLDESSREPIGSITVSFDRTQHPAKTVEFVLPTLCCERPEER